MKDRIVIKHTRSYVNGQLVENEAGATQPGLPPETLTRNISGANHFDYAALETNRAGRLAFSQFAQGCQVIVFSLVFFAAIVVLMSAVSFGFSALNRSDYINAALPCTGAVIMLFVAGWIFTKGNNLGVERYSTDRIPAFLRRLLLPFDLILWRVAALEGDVEKDQRYTTMSQSKTSGSLRSQADLSANDTRRYTYIYASGEQEFTTSEVGYQSFPAFPQKCRIFYLPLSGVMVNLEALG